MSDPEEDIGRDTPDRHLLQLPRTPLRPKKARRVSDACGYNYNNNNNNSLYSPATASCGSPAYNSPMLSSSGFATPNRLTPAHYNFAFSPDQGYPTTPELKTPRVEWMNRKHDMLDALGQGKGGNLFSTSPNEATAKMPTLKDADRYNMEHRNRGKCIVFNHEHFNTGFATREGSATDARRIEQTFQRLGFSVEICDDYEYSTIMSKINELADEDHSDSDCICIFVLSHGLQDDLICAKDVVYKVDNLWKPFTAERCITLAGKPKLFFIQACRGDNLDAGVRLQYQRSTYNTTVKDSCKDSASSSYKIPTHADFLLAYSTVKGFYSWRNPEEGTWYIQSLCDVFDEYAATTDLHRMLTITARKVATNFESYNNLDPSMHDQKQVPSVTSMLIRDLYFTEKNA
ncbi:hypothetical protein QAD02_011531 [Eretmocerus hayati]|uniref:Uncharacterized protein n=1 Tax=Eretmocerus hayati TaxID=131215 RepID=A0ACC2NWQ0_9HYME|nr:hypothetical protein QAD02_011531 [Eretmocerus hayati]